MHISLVGDGRLVSPLAELALRAGHSVVRIGNRTMDASTCSLSELVIVAGDRTTVSDLFATVAAQMKEGTIVVDATVTLDAEEAENFADHISEDEWLGLIPTTRVVRAFASVPAEAFVALLDRSNAAGLDGLAVPLAGDDTDAKLVVTRFMSAIGVDPFDLGPSAVSYVMEPGGPLWGKAVDELEMRECLGWLVGDG
jgi:hypothetical protein